MTIADESLTESIAAMNGRAGAPIAEDWMAAREQALAIRFIRGANDAHKAYLTHLRNSFLDGSDYYYPSTVHEAYNILQRCEPEGGTLNVGDADGVAFVNAGNERGGQRNLDHITCFECGEEGHYARDCPRRNQDGTNLCICGCWE